jgi:hypothetical protein
VTRVSSGAAADPPWVERVLGGEQPAGPRGRLGVLWFVVAVAASALGLWAVAALFAGVAGVAALQTVAAWRRARRPQVQFVAGSTAALLPLAAAFGIALVGAVALLGVVAAVVASVVARAAMPRGRPARPGVLVLAGITLRCGFFPGVGAAAAVLVARTDMTAFVVLLVLVSGYEVGDYLVGTGAGSRVEGPLAGMVAVMVLTFALSVFQFGPFDSLGAWVFGGLVAVAAPLGGILGAMLVPTAAVVGPGLRRLDAWLVVSPLWAWLLWGYVG